MGLLKVGFWLALIGVGLVAGMYFASGELPAGAEERLLDDPSREEVDDEYIDWVELREDGLYVGTRVTGLGSGLEIDVILPSGEHHVIRTSEPKDDVGDPNIYAYDKSGLPAGNYTIQRRSYDYDNAEEVVDFSHTVYLEPPE